MFAMKSQTQKENRVNIKKKTHAELQELYERQRKILSNKCVFRTTTTVMKILIFFFCSRRFVDGLPDKGEKLKQFIAQLDAELNIRNVHKKLCNDMLALKIGSDQLDTLEWTGKHTTVVPKNIVIDDDEDLLKILASHSGVNQHKIIIEYLYLLFKLFLPYGFV